jgi:protein ImuB
VKREQRETRILSVWWPHLAIERWRKTSGHGFQPEAPVVLTIEGTHGPVISAMTKAAAESGAQAGARLTDARALNPGLVAVPADPAGDAALVQRLARWAARWSPLVEVDGPDPSASLGTGGLRMDVSGAAHLFGGEAALAEDVRARFAALGLSSRVAVAPTPGAAWALGHYGPSPLAGEGGARRAAAGGSGEGRGALAGLLAPLPVAALRLPPTAVRTLERLGFKTIGALAGVPRRALARRFREADNPLDALDRAIGRKPEPLIATACEAPPEASFSLAEPASDPAVLPSALARLADPLVRELGKRRLGARRIAFLAFRVDGEVGEAEAETALPTRDPAHIVRLLSEKVQGLDPGFGFDGFKLIARWCEPLDAAQDALLGEPPRELELARLIDRLTARLGTGRVQRPVERKSHLPEQASGWDGAVAAKSKPALPPTPAPQGEGKIRPQRLLDSPEAIAVIYATPEGVPRRFVWRRGVHDIARVQGPERIAPEWWRAPVKARLRDYYRVEDSAGRRFWIYREGLVGDGRGGAPEWYLHGLFG